MSTSLLYHAFGIRGYDYVNTAYEGGASASRSASAGTPTVAPSVVPAMSTCTAASKPVRGVLAIPRVECPRCGVTRQVPLNCAGPRRSYTRSFERYALELSRLMTIQDVAKHLQVSGDVIKDMQKGYRDQEFFKLKIYALHEAKYAFVG